MKGKRVFVLLSVICITTLVLGNVVLAQGGRPGGGGGGPGGGGGGPGGGGPPGGGGGKPLPTFTEVGGELQPYGEGLGFVFDGVQYVIDFGPEWFVPNDCLRGLLTTTGETTILQNGRYTIPLTCGEGDGTICAQVYAPASSYSNSDRVGTSLPLASSRPGHSNGITVWGMVEGKEGYVLLRAWEVHFNGAWRWWRWDGQPWQQMRFLTCAPSGEGE